jgi:hypothetical protein
MRAITHFEVANVVASRVFHHLVGRALDSVGRLQERDSEVEAVEIVLQIGGVINQHELP